MTFKLCCGNFYERLIFDFFGDSNVLSRFQSPKRQDTVRSLEDFRFPAMLISEKHQSNKTKYYLNLSASTSTSQ